MAYLRGYVCGATGGGWIEGMDGRDLDGTGWTVASTAAFMCTDLRYQLSGTVVNDNGHETRWFHFHAAHTVLA